MKEDLEIIAILMGALAATLVDAILRALRHRRVRLAVPHPLRKAIWR